VAVLALYICCHLLTEVHVLLSFSRVVAHFLQIFPTLWLLFWHWPCSTNVKIVSFVSKFLKLNCTCLTKAIIFSFLYLSLSISLLLLSYSTSFLLSLSPSLSLSLFNFAPREIDSLYLFLSFFCLTPHHFFSLAHPLFFLSSSIPSSFFSSIFFYSFFFLFLSLSYALFSPSFPFLFSSTLSILHVFISLLLLLA
jgi:hypothetical protein